MEYSRQEIIQSTNNVQMINSILKSTQGKPCSCPSGKICTNCTPKKSVHPRATVKEPRRLPGPGNSNYYKEAGKTYKQNPTTVQFFEKPHRWKIRKRQKYESPSRSTAICRWYKRRRAIKQLIKEHEKEQEILRRRKREEYEKERIIDIINWEQKKRQRSSSLPSSLKKFKWNKNTSERNQSLPPPQKKHIIHIKNKTAIVKPRAHSKYASVKKHNTRDSITKRFVNYCYRFCCQLYCYLTCIVIITFIVIFIV